jgi:hypothetical protein
VDWLHSICTLQSGFSWREGDFDDGGKGQEVELEENITVGNMGRREDGRMVQVVICRVYWRVTPLSTRALKLQSSVWVRVQGLPDTRVRIGAKDTRRLREQKGNVFTELTSGSLRTSTQLKHFVA